MGAGNAAAARSKVKGEDGRPATFDHVLSSKKPKLARAWIALDPDLAEEHAEAEQAFEIARMKYERNKENLEFEAAKIATYDQLQATREALQDNAVLFVFRSIGRKAYDKLLSSFQPTVAQKEEAQAQGVDPKLLQFDYDQFPPQLISRACVSHEISLDQATEMWQGGDDGQWNGDELTKIFMAAQLANTSSRAVDLGNG